jgi:signal transduction histidine kinase/CheY-like chemotaxis protein
MMSVPLFSKDQIIGVLHIRSFNPNAYSERDLGLAERVGHQIAGAIANAQLFKELMQAEEDKIAIQEQFRQSQKMEAIGGLAGGIAHDFNNLLTVIKGYAELSCIGLDTSDPLRGNIEEILKASERATNLTRQLLAFSRRQILDFKVINLNTLLKDLDKMLHRILGEDIDLAYHLSEDIGKVKTDPGQIEQVILNLAVNSRDAMPSGGKLTIETLNVELDEAYARTHMEISPGHYVMFSVSDSGAGIPPEVRERIFEPFFTTKEKGKGTGLGLSTVYGIVKQSGGNINVYSEPGLGTTFKIYLPRVEEEEDNLQWKDLDISLLTGNETILLAEDEQSVRELAGRILRDRGYQVYEAHDGKDALGMVQGHPERKIHLLLTDVVMPGMSGKNLADCLKLSMPDIKVLFISGYTDNAIVHHGVLDKGVNFIQKPFSMESLARKVRGVLDR